MSCLICKEPVVFGKNYVVVNGKKALEKFELDGKTTHVCKQKEKGFQRAPQKPRERFTFEEFITEDGKTRRLYSVQREGFVGELDGNRTFAELQQLVWKFRAAEIGNPKQGKEE